MSSSLGTPEVRLCYSDSRQLLTILLLTADDTNGNEPTTQALHHIAISPKGPATAIENLSWTIVPVRSSSALANNTIQFSPGSSSLQGFAEELQRVAPSRLLSHSRSGIEVCVLDVLPLALETVFVTLEGDLAKRLLNGEGTFHLEHRQNNGYNSKNKSAGPEDRLTAAVREALGALKVVHSGDFFALPLPPHPITHVPPPPAKVTLCEPVAQGLLAPSTRIIVTQSHHHSSKASRKPPLDRSLHEVAEEAEDTANEQFFSAAEDRYRTDAAVTEDDESQTETETELSAGDDNDDLSDDSMDDMISLQAPMLPITNPSGMSTAQIGSPMGLGMRHHTNGINTPGSIFSTMTSATARPGGQRGRLFKAQGLLQPLPEELLRPVPAKEDDEEARIYVDVSSLAKIGCFSGDWVRLETASEPPSAGLGLWGLGSFGQQQADEDFLWRPARIYSLPEGYGSSRPVAKLPSGRNGNGSHERKTSFFEAQVSRPTSPTVYLSPLLLANLENTPYLRLSPLKRATATKSFSRLAQPKSSSSGAQPLKPPVAREVELVKIASPLSTEALMQNSLFARLKWYFSRRKRVLKEGDLVGVMVDEVLGRTLGPGTGTGGDAGAAEDGLLITSSEPGGPDEQNTATGVVWFRIGHITPARTDDVDAAMEDSELWNGVATIDVAVTKMAQTGIAQSRIPGTADSSWEFYLGLRRTAPAAPSYSSAYSSGSLPTSLPLPVAPSEKPTNLRRRLRDLIAASTFPQARSLDLKPLAVLLTSTQRNIGKSWTVQRACADLGLHVFVIDAYDLLGDAAGESQKQEALLKARAERAMGCGSENCALLIRHAEALTSDRMVGAVESLLEATTAGGTGVRVLVATTTETDKVPEGVRKLFGYELEMGAPDEGEREAILRGIIAERGVSVAGAVDLSAVAVKTAALVAGDLVDVVDRALVSRRSRIETLAAQSSLGSSVTGTGSATGTPITTRDVTVAAGHEGRCLTKQDFDTAVEQARKTFADAIGAPKIPTVTWADVGGLSHIKSAVLETISLPLERPELFAAGLKKRSGILFYGPPGTGKTLLAKAIATEFSLNFFSVKGPELLNMYIGESEANVRRVFQRARDARPCVVFFDELDSVAPKRGNQGDSGGVMDRIVSQLLAELDGMSGGGGDEEGGGGAGGVFVIGATNRPDLLDQALLRPGRFDKMLYLGVSDTREKQVTIMEALTRKYGSPFFESTTLFIFTHLIGFPELQFVTRWLTWILGSQWPPPCLSAAWPQPSPSPTPAPTSTPSAPTPCSKP